MNQALLRRLPSVDEVMRRPEIEALADGLPRRVVVEAVRRALESRRRRILGGETVEELEPGRQEIERLAADSQRPSLRRVVNATGVVIHTNLGRAPLAGSAIEYLSSYAGRYANIEYDLEAGHRGSRYDHITGILAEVIGAEAAHVVNNNAAALLLCAAALARDREIIVSRGELIEIGDGFRIPDVIEQGGAILREVGTTNRTRIGDYEACVGDGSAVLAKIHRSNFYQEGFTEEVSVPELADLARRAGLLVLYDAGSGVLELPETLRSSGEPALGRALREGADVVTASGDKILGGPQAGIIAGRREVVETLRRHPMTRAIRPCKLTIGILHHVLALYRDGRADEIPVFRMLSQTPEILRSRARRLARRVRAALPAQDWAVEVASELSAVGGGALPRERLETWVVRLRSNALSPGEIEEGLRGCDVPVVARIARDHVILDVRTVQDDEIALISGALASLTSSP
jgi:L-seryl-tRNA(Ser) seleniumtransferase